MSGFACDLGGDSWRLGRGDERLTRPGGRSLPRIRDFGPVLRKVQLRERVQGCRSQWRQAQEVRFILCGEVALQPVGGLAESVVVPVRPDQGTGEPGVMPKDRWGWAFSCWPSGGDD